MTTGENLIDDKTPDIVMKRFKKGYGASYHNSVPSGDVPVAIIDGHRQYVSEAWICPVTLLVLGRYPKQINIYLK